MGEAGRGNTRLVLFGGALFMLFGLSLEKLHEARAETLHDSVLKQNHVAARVNQLLHDSLGSRGDFQNA
eukprot:COSAG06_NODE_10142_length_1741_cov_3.216809_1_plen_68_part_10